MQTAHKISNLADTVGLEDKKLELHSTNKDVISIYIYHNIHNPYSTKPYYPTAALTLIR